ncbi:MAG: endonuclease domain-containing protein, partial [Myxococcales bacterium]
MNEPRSLHLLGQHSRRSLTMLARQLRRQPTPAEHAFWNHVRQRQAHGLRFRRQSIVGGYIADFYCAELRLVVELDGSIHERQPEYDRQRDRTMAWLGVRVVRVRNDEVLLDVEGTVERLVQEALAAQEEAARSRTPP